MAEVWKPVPSLPGFLASSEGRLLLAPSYKPMPHGGYRAHYPEPISGSVRRSRVEAQHCYLGTYVAGIGNIKMHQAVCEAFHGPRPFPKAVVIHLDENALNNRPENLKWGTQKENCAGPKYREYCRSRRGDQSPTRKAANRNHQDRDAG